jgi:MoxR-like ATPase
VSSPKVEKVVGPADILRAREVVRDIYVDEKVKEYIVNIILATREPKNYGLSDLSSLIAFGGSPRATIYLNLAAKAHAFIKGRGYVTPEDIKAIGHDVLRHRILVTYEAEAEEVSSDDIVTKIFDAVEVP